MAALSGKGGTSVVQFWVGMRRLTAHWKPLILFEILWKLVTLLVIAPACAGLIQLAIQLAKLKYLTTSNLLQFLRSPWTILLLAVLLLLAALYTLFEIAAVCTCFRQSRFQKVRTTLGRMVRSGLQSVLHFFRGGGPFLVLHLLVLIPLMQFSATSGIFTAMGIPDFLAYYMTKKEFLLPIYVAAIILCCLLSVRWVFSSVLFTQNQCSYRSARATSVQLVRGRFWQTFFSVLVWNCCYFAALLVFLCMITVVVLMVIRATGSNDLIMSQAMRILKLLIQIVLWSFSFFCHADLHGTPDGSAGETLCADAGGGASGTGSVEPECQAVSPEHGSSDGMLLYGGGSGAESFVCVQRFHRQGEFPSGTVPESHRYGTSGTFCRCTGEHPLRLFRCHFGGGGFH